MIRPAHARTVYLSAFGSFLPGDPVANDEMEDYLGRIGGVPSRQRSRVLERNGIQTRHYALNLDGSRRHSNAEMAGRAVRAALDEAGIDHDGVDYLTAATTLSDVLVPGFASLVHGEAGIGPCDIASFGGVCAGGVAALKAAWAQVAAGAADTAVACASEFASRHLRASVLEAAGILDAKGRLPFDAEFLRWMLSDGAGAAILRPEPATTGLSLAVDWIDVRSHADSRPACMYAGAAKTAGNHFDRLWADHGDYTAAAERGFFVLRQDMDLLGDIVPLGVAHYLRLVDEGWIEGIPDHFVCHYSAQHFRGSIDQELARFGAAMPADRWFSTLHRIGNIGSASIYVMLQDLLRSGRLRPGQRVLAMVPESGRFITTFLALRVVEGGTRAAPTERTALTPAAAAPEATATESRTDLEARLLRGLALAWIDFESEVRRLPLIQRVLGGRVTLADYRAILVNLRQQVMEGSRWITRAASNIRSDHHGLRRRFIHHAAEEQGDFLMLEENFVAVGGDREHIRGRAKNLGSEAFSAWMFQQADRENPFHLVGAMAIIEGIGSRLARDWGRRIQKALDLTDAQVSFLLYHGGNDERHLGEMAEAIRELPLTTALVDETIRAARMTARLYRLQLEELEPC